MRNYLQVLDKDGKTPISVSKVIGLRVLIFKNQFL